MIQIISIPSNKQFISLADPNVVDDDLVLINPEQKTVEILVVADNEGRIGNYCYHPGTREISFVSIINSQINVILLNLDTRERSTFLELLEGYELVWAPNGTDYAFTKAIKKADVYD